MEGIDRSMRETVSVTVPVPPELDSSLNEDRIASFLEDWKHNCLLGHDVSEVDCSEYPCLALIISPGDSTLTDLSDCTPPPDLVVTTGSTFETHLDARRVQGTTLRVRSKEQPLVTDDERTERHRASERERDFMIEYLDRRMPPPSIP